jgi:sulfhydrogenase subunit delta
MKHEKLKIGIYALTGCGGDQLAILDCEERLLDLFKAADIHSFSMLKSDNHEGWLDIALVEGSVSTQRDKQRLLDIRERSDVLVAIGVCACVGGIQAAFYETKAWLDNYEKVYGNSEMSHTNACRSRPLDSYVKVDHYLPGCPISEEQFLQSLSRLLEHNTPGIYRFPVCTECKWKENECLLTRGIACVGPLTAGGCGAVCPSHNLPCVGCWGPAQEPNREEMFHLLLGKGFDAGFIRHRMTAFGGIKIVGLLDKLKEIKR